MVDGWSTSSSVDHLKMVETMFLRVNNKWKSEWLVKSQSKSEFMNMGGVCTSATHTDSCRKATNQVLQSHSSMLLKFYLV